MTDAAVAEPPEQVDVASLSRWYECRGCEVSWFGTSSACWSCGDDTRHLGFAPYFKDAAHESAAPTSAAVPATPLTRFGTRVERQAS